MSIVNLLDEKGVRYQISQIRELPPLPQSLHRLIEIIHSEIDSPDELESIIRYDQSLAAKVLRIANSTYYGCRGRTKTISKAIAIIGVNQVRSICICTLLMSMLSNGCSLSSTYRELLWKHALATSQIASEMSRKRPWMNQEEAGVLGLIHDIGRLIMALHFREQFEAIMQASVKRRIPHWCIEKQYGFSHTEVGRYLAARWALPESFRAVIEFHHAPELSSSCKTEVRLIYLANVLSNSREDPDLLEDEKTISYCRELYISEEEWREYQESLGLVWPKVDELWNLLG